MKMASVASADPGGLHQLRLSSALRRNDKDRMVGNRRVVDAVYAELCLSEHLDIIRPGAEHVRDWTSRQISGPFRFHFDDDNVAPDDRLDVLEAPLSGADFLLAMREGDLAPPETPGIKPERS